MKGDETGVVDGARNFDKVVLLFTYTAIDNICLQFRL